MPTPTRDEAWDLVCEWIQSDSLRKHVLAVEAAMRAFPEVLECHMLMGETDFLLKVVTRDVEEYERFLRDRLSSLASVLEVQSSMALTTVKQTARLPLTALAPGAET